MINLKTYNNLLKLKEDNDFKKTDLFKYIIIMLTLIVLTIFSLTGFNFVDHTIQNNALNHLLSGSLAALTLLNTYSIKYILKRTLKHSFWCLFFGFFFRKGKFNREEPFFGFVGACFISFLLFFAINLPIKILSDFEIVFENPIGSNIYSYLIFGVLMFSIVKVFLNIKKYIKKLSIIKNNNFQEKVDKKLKRIEKKLDSELIDLQDHLCYSSIASQDDLEYAGFEIKKRVDVFYKKNGYKNYQECILAERNKKIEHKIDMEIENT